MSDDVTISAQKKTRGRPVGSIREVYFTLSTAKIEQIQVTRKNENGQDISAEDMRNEAIEYFTDKFNLKPESVLGPFFEAQLSQSPGPKRESIRMAQEDINYSRRKVNARLNNWEVLARFIEDDDGIERTDIAHIFYIKEIDMLPGEKPKAPPRPTLKMLSELTDIVEIIKK